MPDWIVRFRSPPTHSCMMPLPSIVQGGSVIDQRHGESCYAAMPSFRPPSKLGSRLGRLKMGSADVGKSSSCSWRMPDWMIDWKVRSEHVSNFKKAKWGSLISTRFGQGTISKGKKMG